jgi:glucose/arabinose dehydrogenase/endonuclease YncB( thermonuclease family)
MCFLLKQRFGLIVCATLSVVASYAQRPIVPAGGAARIGSGNVQVLGFTRAIDGDTLEIESHGTRVGVGLIGVVAPPVNTTCGAAAAAKLQSLVMDGVWLIEDPSLVLDGRKRRLYYATTRDGKSIALEMTRAGLVKPNGLGREKRLLDLGVSEARRRFRGCVDDPQRGPGHALDVDAAPASSLKAGAGAGVAAKAEPGGNYAIAGAIGLGLPQGFDVDVVGSGFVEATSFAMLPDGRILVAEKQGIVKIIKNSSVLPTPFIDIRKDVSSYWDRGLIGIGVDPNFSANGYVYLFYTYENDPATISGSKTARLTRVVAVGDTANPASQVVLLGTAVGSSCKQFPAGADCLPAEAPSHSVGTVRFGSDGSLFVTQGDGASFTVVDDNALLAQNLDSLAGKLLRIDRTGAGLPGNPFWNGSATANRSKVWVYGLRNAFRFGMHPQLGFPYIGDVGWSTWEEISAARSGRNLGWPCFEGQAVQGGYSGYPLCQALYSATSSPLVWPLIQWNHDEGSAAATGGAFYPGSVWPTEYRGAYFYGDYARQFLRYVNVDSNDAVSAGPSPFGYAIGQVVDLQFGSDDALYYISITDGQLRRIRYVGAAEKTPPVAHTLRPSDGATGVPAEITVTAAFTERLDASTVNTTTVYVTQTGNSTAISATVSYDLNTTTVSLKPTSPLTLGGTYVVTLVGGSAGIKDVAGNPLASNVVWSFSTNSLPPSGTVFLSDLSWTFAQNGWGPPERDRSNGEQAAGDGTAIRLNGTTFAKGLGVHAASELRYFLGGSCNSFTSVVGVDDEIGAAGSVVFQVWGDRSAKLYESPVMTGASASLNVNVSVTGFQELTLIVTDGGNGITADHGDWANAQVTCGSGPTDTTPPTVVGTEPTTGATGIDRAAVLRASFSEPMNSATVTSSTFTLTKEGASTPVAATVNYDATSRAALLSPSSPLDASSIYTARVRGGSTGVADAAGNRMATDRTWSFSTVTAPSAGTTYLSDLNWTSATNGWGPVERDMSNGEMDPRDGTSLRLNGVTYTKGLGVHANSEIHYPLSGRCNGFAASVGVDDEVGTNGSVIFQVFADTVKLFDSGVMTGSSPTVPVAVDVTGRNDLVLVVTDGGNGNVADHADWADARITCGTSSSNTPPVATITQPSATLKFKVGDVINYSGSATDTEDGALAPSKLAWAVTLHHCSGGLCHAHPFVSTSGVSSGGFTAPDHGDESYFEIALTATDSGGLTHTAKTFLYPNTVRLTLNSSPAGMQLVYAGQTATAPITRVATVGSAVTISAVSPQGAYSFSSWSDNGAQQHNIVVGTIDATYTATFTNSPGDTTPPAISGVKTISVGRTDATIEWVTNEAATTQVEYGTTAAYGTLTTLDATLVTLHRQTLTGLKRNTLYHYRVRSRDAAGNTSLSGDYTFRTPNR